ncbi:MAG: hypothetical protein R2805_11300 [Flavobacterium sp.]|uniref:hypothetical protein n=1 Tax=Flavobacterium sp. TaxID=239 RepID=UPI003529174E
MNQLNWWNLIATDQEKINIENYVNQNTNVDEANEFALQFITQSYLNQNLTLDFEASKKSPANIDLSNVQGTTEAEKKLRCVYEKLTQSPTFKKLFQNTFEANDRINVKLELVDVLPNNNTTGNCQLSTTTTNGITTYLNTIKIKKSILEEGNTNSQANIIIANTILHEFIHAYLNIKKINCNNGTSLPYLNNLELHELITIFYQNFDCEINVNGSPQSQHSFMFDFMLPTFQQILSEIRNDLIPQNQITTAENINFFNQNLNVDEPWDWQKFYRYLSLAGLHNCQSFQEVIGNNPVENFLFNVYYTNANYFSKSCN